MISKEPAIVFRGGGRRWFTRQAAANAEAKAAINLRCDCDSGHWPIRHPMEPPHICEYHCDLERYAKIKRRLARMAVKQYLEAKDGD